MGADRQLISALFLSRTFPLENNRLRPGVVFSVRLPGGLVHLVMIPPGLNLLIGDSDTGILSRGKQLDRR